MQNVFQILTADQETNFTPESKRLIRAKTKKQNNGIHGVRRGGGSLKDENEMALAKSFIFLNFNFLSCIK